MIWYATEVVLQGRTPSYHSKSDSEMPYALLNGVCREDREWPQSGSRRTSDNATADLAISSVLMVVPNVSFEEETKKASLD